MANFGLVRRRSAVASRKDGRQSERDDERCTHVSCSALPRRRHVRTATVSNRQPSDKTRRVTRRLATFASRTQSNSTHARTLPRQHGVAAPSKAAATSTTRGLAAARTSLSIAVQPHGMATAGATRRVRRFKRYVTVSPGPIIGRREDRRPIGRALAGSRGKTKCSVTVARRNSTANSRPQFFNRSFADSRRCSNKSERRLCVSDFRNVAPTLRPVIDQFKSLIYPSFIANRAACNLLEIEENCARILIHTSWSFRWNFANRPKNKALRCVSRNGERFFKLVDC